MITWQEHAAKQEAATKAARRAAGHASGTARRAATVGRDRSIYLRKFAGIPSATLAEKYGITRQAVEYIFRRHSKEEIQ